MADAETPSVHEDLTKLKPNTEPAGVDCPYCQSLRTVLAANTPGWARCMNCGAPFQLPSNTALDAPDSRRDATVMELAQVIADSRAFPECRSPAAAAVRILAGREMGIGPIAAVGGIRVQNGRVSMDAVLMAGCIRRSNDYDYQVVEHTAENCVLHFTRRGELIGLSTFSIADAERAGLTKNDTWSKYPRNMLFARALSNGARWYCPDIFGGGSVYTHEELGVTVDEEGRAVDSGGGADLCTRSQREEIRRLAEAAGKPLAGLLSELGVRMLDELSGYEADKLIRKLAKKAKAVESAGEPEPSARFDAQALQDVADESRLPSTPQQRQKILDLAERLLPDERECREVIMGALERRGRKTILELDHLEAATIIEGLERRLAESEGEAACEQAPFDVAETPPPSSAIPPATR